MHLSAIDGSTGKPATTGGLAGIATLIKEARAEAHAAGMPCVLFDNGDVLQGTPLAETLADMPVTADHALVRCFAALRYDAVGLGNHDLDFGLRYLFDVAEHLPMPLLASNLEIGGASPLKDCHIIFCILPGSGHKLRIGVFSVLPENTAIWNAGTLNGGTRVRPVRAAAEIAAAHLREQGADLVIALAHMGPDRLQSEHGDQTPASPLDDLTCADAVIAGHTHLRSPSPQQDTISPRPMVMPGFAGSDLGVLDLHLHRTQEGALSLKGHTSTLRRNGPDTEQHESITAICNAVQKETAERLHQPIGMLKHPLHSYFALARPTPTSALIARAQERAVRNALRRTLYADLPIISAAADPRIGGRGGPWDYVDIEPGILRRSDLSDLCPYRNSVWAVLMTGAEIRARMNQTVRVFGRLSLSRPDQTINDPSVPGFEFDNFYGLTCQIDLTRDSQRIRNLSFRAQPVKDDDLFVLAINQFRAAGGGGVGPLPEWQVLVRNIIPIREAVTETLAAEGFEPALCPPPWSFVPGTGLTAILHTSPAAIKHLDRDLPGAVNIGQSEEGFAIIRFAL